MGMKLLTTGMIAVAVCASPAFAERNAIYVGGGTDGLGLGYRYTFAPGLNIRAEYNRYEYTWDGTHGDLDYSGKMRLGSSGVLADWFPFPEAGFRLTLGALQNDMRFKGKARQGNGSVTLNGTQYQVGPDDQIRAEVTFGHVQPYLGIGWGHRDRVGLGFFADIGALKSSAKATLTSTVGSPGDIEGERKKLEDDVGSVSWYPIVKMGLFYAF